MNEQAETGYLIVRASTALGAIPLENATVTVRGIEPENEGVRHILKTNSDGNTEKLALPAPPKSNSESEGNARPYALYAIDVFRDGYIPLFLSNVPVFSSVVSIQPAVLVPAPEGPSETHFPPDRSAYLKADPNENEL